MTVPFSPYFLQQVQAGHVKSISTKGYEVEGTFTTKLRYHKKATPTTLFATQVPQFWSNQELTSLLRSEGVQVNAQSTTTSTSLLAEILLGFGPTLLLVGVFVLIARRSMSRRRYGCARWVRTVEGAPS